MYEPQTGPLAMQIKGVKQEEMDRLTRFALTEGAEFRMGPPEKNANGATVELVLPGGWCNRTLERLVLLQALAKGVSVTELLEGLLEQAKGRDS